MITCIRHIEKYGLNTIGIFRVSTSKKRVRQLREDFDRGTYYLDENICPHDVATLLKEYFRDLPEPLLCRNLYSAFVRTQSKCFLVFFYLFIDCIILILFSHRNS